MAARAQRGNGGFSLLEVMVGLTILAMGLAALYSSFSTAIRVGERTDDRLIAIQVAQSVLDQYIAGRVFNEKAARGNQGHHEWLVTIDPADDMLTADQQPGTWQLYHIGVTVTWPGQRRVYLQTLHLARGR